MIQGTKLFEKEAIVFLNLSELLSLMQCANNFPCDWVIAGIHKNNDKEVKSRRFYMPEEWSTWVSWVKSQLWCVQPSQLFY